MIIVVGAGPAGLALGYHLERHGLPYRILEKEDIGHSWQSHYDQLRLHTLKQVSALPGLPMPEEYPDFPTADQVVAYLKQYARHFELNIETGVAVTDATFQDGWRLETTQGPMAADVLMVATGIWSTPRRPRFAGEDQFRGRVLHAAEYDRPEPFAGQRVVVVGAGNSGTEIAVEVSRKAAETSIVVRSGVDFVPYPGSQLLVQVASWLFRHAPRPVGEWLLDKVREDFSHLNLPPAESAHIDAYPVVGYELPEAVAEGRVSAYNQSIDRFTEQGVCLEEGQELRADAIILATGYRPTLDFVQGEVELDDGGQPVVDEHWRSRRNPQLYCVGFYYPATEGWLQSVGRVTRQAVEQVAKDYKYRAAQISR